MSVRKDYGPKGCAERGVFLGLIAAMFLSLTTKAVRRKGGK